MAYLKNKLQLGESKSASVLVLHMTLTMLMLFFPLLANAWLTNGRDAMTNMALPQAKMSNSSVWLIVSYEKRWSCRPTISLILFHGKNLGAPLRQNKINSKSDQLSITVDGSTFTNETKGTIYANGLELAMFAPSGLVGALKNARTVVARSELLSVGGFDFSGSKNFETSNSAALANCN